MSKSQERRVAVQREADPRRRGDAMTGSWVEYVGSGPGWPGVWPEPGDRGRVLDEDGESVLVRWRLRVASAALSMPVRDVEVWTQRDRVEVMR